jgi:hypothetical protein
MSDIYFGKGLSSKELYKQIQETCDFPASDLDTGDDSRGPCSCADATSCIAVVIIHGHFRSDIS